MSSQSHTSWASQPRKQTPCIDVLKCKKLVAGVFGAQARLQGDGVHMQAHGRVSDAPYLVREGALTIRHA